MKQNLRDTTFLLIVRLDSLERIENVIQVANYLYENFDTHIMIWECADHYNGVLKKFLPADVTYKFLEDHDPILYRTKYINMMTKAATTKYIAVWDIDVIAKEKQIYEAVCMLREGYDFVYPYKNRFLEVTPEIRNTYLTERKGVDFLMEWSDFMEYKLGSNPVGGAFFANVESYVRSGMENENFYGWGIEDGERFQRWLKKGYRIFKIDGPLFHLTHPIMENSQFNNDNSKTIKYREYINSLRQNL